ncbi:ADOP family duplicated permease [Gaopeijia maritima]|uniref:ADOP family duplicated permease n=1 Tax=Gaopeijia maritima TaxID=3119007 RepID=A0ABU9E4L3_9BACT
MRRLTRFFERCLPGELRRTRGADYREFWRAMAEEPRYRGLRGRTGLTVRMVMDVLDAHARGWMRATGDRSGGGWTMRRGSVRFALRGLRRHPLFGGVAVGTLALGVAAATAVFAVTWSVLLEPLPYPDSEELTLVHRPTGRSGSVSWPDFVDWREGMRGSLAMAAYTETGQTIRGDAGARTIYGARVTQGFFAVFDVPLALGRGFTGEEDTFDGPEAVVLSHGLFVREFGADPALVGGTIDLGGGAVEVVGVAAPGFAFPGAGTEFWMPLHEDRLLQEAGLPVGGRSLHFLNVVARYEADPTPTVARLEALVAGVDDTHAREEENRGVAVTPLREHLVGDVRSTLVFLLAAAVLVLVVAAFNVAAVSLSRADDREREFRIRAAVGAGRAALRGQVFTESAVIAVLAAAVGLPLAALLLRVLLVAAPTGLPRATDLAVGLPVLGFGVAIALVTGLLFGIAPAAKASRAGGRGLPAGSRGSVRSGTRLQQAMVVAQVGATVIVLFGAVLMFRSYQRLTGEELGFDPRAVVVAQVGLPEGSYDDPVERDRLFDALVDRLRAHPAVAQATSTYSPPMAGNDLMLRVAHEDAVDDADTRWAQTVIVRDGYFETLGIPMLAGRDFDTGDRLGAPAVVVVSRSLAETLWPGEDPLGRRLVHAGGLRGSVHSFDRAFFPDEPYTVVGVVDDIRGQGFGAAPEPALYRPHAQITWGTQYLLARVTGEPAVLAGVLPELIWEEDSRLPVDGVTTLPSIVAGTVSLPRFRTLLLGSFAGTTCLLAMVGLYGVMALNVARRRCELGVRIALGASRSHVLGNVVRRGAGLAVAGATLGLAVAVPASSALESLVYQVAPTDPLTWAAVLATVATVTALALWIPARRAGRVDPVESLAAE